jgi:NhaC family Na+:H+ antiporter
LNDNRTPSSTDALIPIFAIVVLLAFSLYLFGDESSQGANQIALILCTGLAAIVGIKNGYSWKEVEDGISEGIGHSIGAILILFAVGSMIGTWILSGTVPAMVYWGMKFLSVDYFYAQTCFICALVALSIGSSWTTAGTLGIGLIGIAEGMGLSIEITAGAIISGAYFGDKLSPLSETTNMASAVAEAELFAHIRNMLWTTVPSFILATTAFLVIGFIGIGNSGEALTPPLGSIDRYFDVSWYIFIPLVALLGMARAKVPAFPAILISALIGAVMAVIFQPELVIGLANASEQEPLSLIYLKGVWVALFNGYDASFGVPVLDNLLSRGGMSSMLITVWLIVSAMAFGGVLQKTQVLEAIFRLLKRFISGAGSAIMTAMATCLGINVITGDQYIAIVLPGRMYQAEFKRLNLSPLALSRAIEDAGTISSPLIPWNTCGAYMSATLGVATVSYLPYALFNLINIALAFLFAGMGWLIVRTATNKVDGLRGDDQSNQ